MDTRLRARRRGAAKQAVGPRSASPVSPDDRFERALGEEGFGIVAGLDEVGRGAWAGPVSVGVVVFPPHLRPPEGLRDSKMLTEDRRETLYPLIMTWCTDWSVAHAGPDECDRLGMTVALRLAARRALATLRRPPHAVLMDGAFDYLSDPSTNVPLPGTTDVPALPEDPPHVRTVVRGDSHCVSIAAASIVAKVTRDRMMRSLSTSFPAFDFDRNKGYPSPVHRTALAGFGLTSVHRRSWAFVDHMAFR
ncbi:MAG: ribonuclease HII [Acidimicrobiales bacterium]